MSVPPPRSASALATPNFLLFWLAQAISKFGDPITVVALAAITYRLTGSALYTTAALLVATVPQATFGFFAGAIADALGHRRAMIVADLLRTVLIGAIPLVLQAELPLAVAYVLVLAAGLCSAVFSPARVSLLPTLLTREQLMSGNSAVYATDRAVEIAGAVAGGLLVASLGAAVFYVDALTFLVSALLLLRVSVSEAPPRAVSWGQAFGEGLVGLRVIRDSVVLRANTVFSLLAQLCIPILTGLLPVLIFRRFAPDDLERGAVLFGVAEAAIAAGAVIGSLVLPRLSRRIRKGRLVIAGFASCGASLVAAAYAPGYELLLVALVVTGFTNVLFFVPNMAILQEHAPVRSRGAVIGARISLLSLTWLPVALMAGGLADVADVAFLIAGAGAFTVVVALAAVRLPAVAEVP